MCVTIVLVCVLKIKSLFCKRVRTEHEEIVPFLPDGHMTQDKNGEEGMEERGVEEELVERAEQVDVHLCVAKSRDISPDVMACLHDPKNITPANMKVRNH